MTLSCVTYVLHPSYVVYIYVLLITTKVKRSQRCRVVISFITTCAYRISHAPIGNAH